MEQSFPVSVSINANQNNFAFWTFQAGSVAVLTDFTVILNSTVPSHSAGMCSSILYQWDGNLPNPNFAYAVCAVFKDVVFTDSNGNPQPHTFAGSSAVVVPGQKYLIELYCYNAALQSYDLSTLNSDGPTPKYYIRCFCGASWRHLWPQHRAYTWQPTTALEINAEILTGACLRGFGDP